MAAGADRHDDVPLVDHLVVLEVVQEGGWSAVRVAGQEDSGAGDAVRRVLLRCADEVGERHLLAAGLLRRGRGCRSRHVTMMVMSAPPSRIGTQPPLRIFRLLAAKNAASITRNGSITATPSPRSTSSIADTTMARSASTTMLPVTEMP